jgi:hypothetical protein
LKADDPGQLLREALKNLIAQGYDTVSPTHVTLEARRLLGQAGGLGADKMPGWLTPGWVGRMLRGVGVIDDTTGRYGRVRLFGMNLRFFRISESYLMKVKEDFASGGVITTAARKQPTDFCGACETCQYSAFDCEVMRKRQRVKKTPARSYGKA